jgi:hypothetical protein
MPVGLDLAPSRAKLARAREHLDTLQRETTAGVKQDSPYAVRFSQVDPQTGWCSITLVPQKGAEPRLGAIFGDVVHNLRCALDYVVTALVDASGAKLSTKHQFPIYKDAAEYAAKVGTKTEALPNGPLGGITDGLTLIAEWQPYKTKPDPRTDPLWGIHRFSNADKHREPATFATVPVGALKLAYNGIVVESEPGLEITGWEPGDDVPVGRIRFDPPRAENLRAEGEVRLDVWFVTPAFRSDADLTIKLGNLPGVIQHVATMLDLFGQL